jgi:NADPH-dependent glutamate synthase beta subunit-like oxidoreductase
VTVFERNDRAGGLLQYGIPSMKLSKEVVARRVRLLAAEGVRFECNVDVGKDISATDLANEYVLWGLVLRGMSICDPGKMPPASFLSSLLWES